MGSTNFGNQIITLDFHAPAESPVVNTRELDIRALGIYRGGLLAKVNDTTVSVAALVCEISDGSNQVRVQTQTSAQVTVSNVNTYVVLRWAYTGTVGNYMDMLAVSSGSVQSTDLILGKCVFSGVTLNGFNYSERSSAKSFDKFGLVEPTAIPSLSLVVRACVFDYGTISYILPETVTSAFVPPGANSRVDLIYLDTDGQLKIAPGSPAPSPVAPGYNGKMVLAEVTVVSGATQITSSNIRDVRPFFKASTFTSLPDAPSTFVGASQQYPRVNVGETALEFVGGFRSNDLMISLNNTPPSGWTDITGTYPDKMIRVSATPGSTGGQDVHVHSVVGHSHTVNAHAHGGVTQGHALSEAELATHTHPNVTTDTVVPPGSGNAWPIRDTNSGYQKASPGSTGSSGSGTPHTHPINAESPGTTTSSEVINQANNVPAFVGVRLFKMI